MRARISLIGRAPRGQREGLDGRLAPARLGGGPVRSGSLPILFLVSAHSGLSQRALIALRELGHEVTVAVVDTAAAMQAAGEHAPGVIACPFLKTMSPGAIWTQHRCPIVHPGPRGDRGPSSLDWPIELERVGRNGTRGQRRVRRRQRAGDAVLSGSRDGEEKPWQTGQVCGKVGGIHRYRVYRAD